jgi:sulfonate transport system substrate-binding protein
MAGGPTSTYCMAPNAPRGTGSIRCRKRRRAWLPAALLSLWPAATAAQAEPPDLSGIVLHVGLPNKMGDRLPMIASGALKGAPYKVEWLEFSATPALLQALRNGDVDVGGNGGSTAIIQSEALSPGAIKIAGIGYFVATGPQSGASALLVAASSSLRSLADLKGRKISALHGTGVEYLLAEALERQHLTQADVRISSLPNSAALAALLNQSIDAWAIWDPQATALLERPDIRLLAWLGDPDDEYEIQYASSRSLEDEKKRAAIEDFLRRLAGAQVWSSRHPAEWAREGSALIGLPESVMLKIAAKTSTLYGLTPDRMDKAVASFTREARFWKEHGKINDVPDIRGIIDGKTNQILLDATRQALAAQPHQPG